MFHASPPPSPLRPPNLRVPVNRGCISDRSQSPDVVPEDAVRSDGSTRTFGRHDTHRSRGVLFRSLRLPLARTRRLRARPPCLPTATSKIPTHTVSAIAAKRNNSLYRSRNENILLDAPDTKVPSRSRSAPKKTQRSPHARKPPPLAVAPQNTSLSIIFAALTCPAVKLDNALLADLTLAVRAAPTPAPPSPTSPPVGDSRTLRPTATRDMPSPMEWCTRSATTVPSPPWQQLSENIGEAGHENKPGSVSLSTTAAGGGGQDRQYVMPVSRRSHLAKVPRPLDLIQLR